MNAFLANQAKFVLEVLKKQTNEDRAEIFALFSKSFCLNCGRVLEGEYCTICLKKVLDGMGGNDHP
jgi:recombinational DNA repair protein RecR